MMIPYDEAWWWQYGAIVEENLLKAVYFVGQQPQTNNRSYNGIVNVQTI